MILAATAMLLTACGNKSKNTATNADSTEIADTLNTVEAVVKQVKAVYDYLAHFDAEKGMPWLDERFGTKAWRKANDEVELQKEVGGDDEDEGFWVNGYDPWTRECYEGKITVSDIKAELQTDGTAKVSFKMKDAMMSEPEDVCWTIRVEDGEWRVDDMLDGNESLRGKMSRWLAERVQALPNAAVQKDEILLIPDLSSDKPLYLSDDSDKSGLIFPRYDTSDIWDEDGTMSYDINIGAGGSHFQTLHKDLYGKPVSKKEVGRLILIDLNQDGYCDVLVCNGRYGKRQDLRFDAWVWQQQGDNGIFHFVEDFRNISNPAIRKGFSGIIGRNGHDEEMWGWVRNKDVRLSLVTVNHYKKE